MTIAGTEGLSFEQIREEVTRGGRFVMFDYCISLCVITFRRSSRVFYVRPGKSAFGSALPYSLLSLALGWWGFPFGLVFTPMALLTNLQGGRNVTQTVLGSR